MATPRTYALARAHFSALRQSTLARFADCQLSAGFELRLALFPPGGQLHRSGWTNHRAACGRIVHDAIARCLRHMVEHGEERIAPEMAIGFYEDALRQADLPVWETFAMPAHEDAFARRIMRKWARDNVFTIADFAGVEERMEFVVSYEDPVAGRVERTLTGQLDALLIDPTGQHATVPDWKASWRLPPTKTYEEDEDGERDEDDALSVEGYFQQRFYAVPVFIRYPSVQSVTLREFYLPRSKPREATIWRHELPGLLSYFSALVERFDRCYTEAATTRRGRVRKRPLASVKEWGEPSPGGHCSFCPAALDCPLGDEAREAGMIRTPEDAERVAGMLLVARRAAKTLDRSLRTWADHYGPTKVRDAKRERFFGYVERERVDRPTRRQVEEAMLAGRNPVDLYRRRIHTQFTDYSPDEDVSVGLDDDDVVQMFERAAELASKRKRGRRRSAA